MLIRVSHSPLHFFCLTITLAMVTAGCGRSSEADREPADAEVSQGPSMAEIASLAKAVNRAHAADRSGTRPFAEAFVEPAPAPELPAEADVFQPPAVRIDAREQVGLSQWTRSAGPGEHLILAGYGFTGGGNPRGRRTRFAVFAQTTDGNAVRGEAEVVHIEPHQAIVRLPDKVEMNGMLLLFPRNEEGVGRPVAVNRTEVWYTVPESPAPGSLVSLVGRNLSHEAGEQHSWVYLKPQGGGELGVWAQTVQVNPYKVDFVIPEKLPPGKYEVWVHNGHGGRYGWSALHHGHGGSLAPAHLKVTAPRRWDGPVLDVTRFGADGRDDADDADAVLKALAKANQTRNATLHFPAGTYYVAKPISPVVGPDKSGMRIRGEGRDKTFIKGLPGSPPKVMMHITGGDVEIRDLTLDINELGEATKYYRGTDRGEHNPEHYAYLEKVKTARDAIKKWRKRHKGQDVPASMRPPPSPNFPDVKKRQSRVASAKKRGSGDLMTTKGWAGGLRIVNCVLDAERRNISLQQGGISRGGLQNCDIVGQEIRLGCPKFARIDGCHFFARADTAVIMYMYGGWCNVVTNCTGQDYMPNTYDTGMGRFYTVTAYGNRQENVYVGGNVTKDLTVNPLHWNQNSGEQIMWEDMPITSTQKPIQVGEDTLRFERPLKGKIKWHSDAIIAGGRGLGQYRRIADYDKKTNTITLVRPWDVPPDTDSLIMVGRPVRRIVVYGNRLDAKPRAAQADHHIASAGVEPFGASVDMIVEKNTFHQLRTGIATFSPHLFHHYAHNQFIGTRVGARIGYGTGATLRGNRHRDTVLYAYQSTSSPKHSTRKLEVIEYNRGDNTPVAARVGARLQKDPENCTVLLHRNTFDRGDANTAPSAAIWSRDPADTIRVDNTFTGYEHIIGTP